MPLDETMQRLLRWLTTPLGALTAVALVAVALGPGLAQASGHLSGAGEPPTWCLVLACGALVAAGSSLS